jgi:CBS domain containing-hemolysin-like protein
VTTTILIAIGVILLCLISEAFFAAAELSIINADGVRLEDAARAGDRRAERVLWFRNNPERLFATTLLGTNLSTVTGSTLAALTLTSLVAEGGDWLALAIMSPAILIGAEIIPKSLAQANADAVAPRLAGPLLWIHKALTPPIFLIRTYASALYRRLGLDGAPSAMVSREELALLMEQESGATGDIEDDEREMISRIFEFSRTTARDTMLPLIEVRMIHQDATVREAAQLIAQEGFSRLPVYRDRVDDVVGLLHHMDLLRARNGDAAVSELMTAPHFVPESQEIDDLLVILQRKAASAAIVVDEFGGAVGLLTLEDILEEIVGDIEDEHDHEGGMWRQGPDGGWLVNARAPIHRLNEELGLTLGESTEYETLAGYILEEVKRIPRPGAQIQAGDLTLTVTRSSDRAIEEVRIHRAARRKRLPRT